LKEEFKHSNNLDFVKKMREVLERETLGERAH